MVLFFFNWSFSTDLYFLKPEGWTTDPDMIGYDYYWAPQDSYGQCMAKEFGLNDPQPIMVTTPDTGAPLVFFRSGEKFYFWNEVENNVWEVTKPGTLGEIIWVMINKGEKAVKSRKLKRVGSGGSKNESCD
jgi:hypothetical protein